MPSHRPLTAINDPLKNLKRRNDMPVRQHGLDLAIYDPVANVVHVLNPVATAAWHQLPDRTFEQISEMLAQSFPDAKSGTVARDLHRFIASLQKLNLLTAGKQGRRAAPKFRMPLPFPGTAISVDRGYARPDVKTYSMKQMAKLVDKARILKIFCDL
jgi:hypothetical protein